MHRCTPHTKSSWKKRAPDAAWDEYARARAWTRPRHNPQLHATPRQPNAQHMEHALAIASQVSMPLNANINSIDLRRECPMAREIFYQGLMNQAHNHPHIVCMGRCVSCGQPTGNFCDPCVNAGRTFVVPTGQILAGAPICSQCEDFHCYVCAGIVPPGPVGQPTAPIVTLAPVMQYAQYADDTVLPAGQ